MQSSCFRPEELDKLKSQKRVQQQIQQIRKQQQVVVQQQARSGQVKASPRAEQQLKELKDKVIITLN